MQEADWQHWRAEDFNPYLEVVLDAFGPERLMFGSDWPVCLLAADYAQVKSLVATHIDSLPPRQKEEIFGLSAVNLYGLENLPNGSEDPPGAG